jgi:hypothetical protein
MIKEEAKKVS